MFSREIYYLEKVGYKFDKEKMEMVKKTAEK